MRLVAILLGLLLICGAIAEDSFGNRFVAPKRWALVIGASRYPELGNLRFPRRDAKAFRDTLLGPLQFRPEAVSLLSDAEGEKPPTNANIRAELDRVLADPRLNSGDLFIFYFSGHGAGTPKGDYLAPTDATLANVGEVGLPIRELTDRFVKKGLRNVLVIVDACRGGAENQFGEELITLSEKANLAVMLSCQPGLRSYESADDGHGYFTAALLKALADPKLSDPASGALWTSAVAAKVSIEVASRTAEAYGEKDRQIPTAFADDRRDVLLAATIPSTFSPEAITQLRDRLKGIDPAKQEGFFSLYAMSLMDAGRGFEAAELLRAMDGLSPLEPDERTLLGIALDAAGRSAEAQIELKKVLASDNVFWADLAVLSLAGESTDPALLQKAVERAYSALKSPEMAVNLGSILAAQGDPEGVIRFAEARLKDQTNPRVRLFMEALKLRAESDTQAYTAKLDAALEQFGLLPDDENLRMLRYQGLLELGQMDEIDKLAQDAIAAGQRTGWWHLMRAAALKRNEKTDEAFVALQSGLKEGIQPGVLPLAFMLAGKNLRLVDEAILAQCNRYPKAWQAILIKGLIEAMQGKGDLPTALSQAEKYCDNEMDLKDAYISSMSPFLEELHDAGALPDENYTNTLRILSGGLCLDAAKFGKRDQLWYFLMNHGLVVNRSRQVYELTTRHLEPRRKSGKLNPDLRLYLLIAAFNYGDFAKVDALLNEPHLPIARLYGAVASLLRGDEKLARERVEGLRLIGHEQEILDAVRAYLARDLDGLKLAAKRGGAPCTLAGLAYLKLGDPKSALECLRQTPARITYRFDPVTFAGLRELVRLEPARAVEVANFVQSGFAPTPLSEPFSFGDLSVAAFKGEYAFAGILETDNQVVAEVKPTFSVDAAGNVKGMLDKELAFTAKVDRFGNLTGTVVIAGETQRIFGKLAPVAVFRAEPEMVWLLTLLDGESRRIQYALKFSSAR